MFKTEFWIVCGPTAAILVVIAVTVWIGSAPEARKVSESSVRPDLTGELPDQPMPMVIPGIQRPITQPAAEAEIADDAEVIGVSVDGKHRAYLRRALEMMDSRVINDLIEATPVTVTFCDQNDQARVFSSPRRGAVINLFLGGWKDGQMQLRLDENFYAHDSQQIPLSDFPFERTTWGTWKTAHPDTDVFVGRSSRRDHNILQPSAP